MSEKKDSIAPSQEFLESAMWLMEHGDPVGLGAKSPRFFDGAQYFRRDMFDVYLKDMTMRRKDINVATKGLGKIDCSFMCRGYSERVDDGKTLIEFLRFRQLSMDEKPRLKGMGLIPGLTGKVVESAVGHMFATGEFRTWRAWSYFDPDSHYWHPPTWQTPHRDSGIIGALTAVGIMFHAHSVSWWWTEMTVGDGFPIRFLTDPIGIREVFRLREVPPGKQRRQALRHWVAEHWRQTRSDPDTEFRVREHLRGATEFRWGDLSVKVHVPAVLAASTELAKAEGPKRRPRMEAS